MISKKKHHMDCSDFSRKSGHKPTLTSNPEAEDLGAIAPRRDGSGRRGII